jgi:hypothetical protein
MKQLKVGITGEQWNALKFVRGDGLYLMIQLIRSDDKRWRKGV